MSYSFSHSYPWFTVVSIIFQFWQPPLISPSLFLFIWNQICLSWSFKVKKLDVKVIYLLQQRYEYFRLPPPPFFFNPLLFSLPLPVKHPIPLLEVARSWAVLQFSVPDFWGGPFTLHGWGSQVWRRYSRVSQGIL